MRRLVCLVLFVTLGGLAPANGVAGEGRSDLPNVVVILTDDQRWDTLWSMPTVQSELIGHGIEFTNGFVVNPLCCPSRASLITGQYSHTHGVYTNAGPYGGFQHFAGDDSTIATWLHDGGYWTGFVGKYLNGYRPQDGYIPPGWDRWVAMNLGYYNYWLNIDGVPAYFGSDPEDYSTDVLGADAASFIRDSPTDQPLLLDFAPYAPHGPATPSVTYQDAFSDLPPWRPPSYNEKDVSDKPLFIQNTPRLTLKQKQHIDNLRRNQYRTLLSVDDALADIISALSDTGRLSNTLIVLASDNGLEWGEHRWSKKDVAYEESIRVPMIVRYDPLIQTPRVDSHLLLNIDLAPTFAELAGVTATGAEGQSLVPLIESPDAAWRDDFLIEHLYSPINESTSPTFCAVRNEGFTYVEYQTGEDELYDLAADPYQLLNVSKDPGYAATVAAMQNRLVELCSPPPPGFTPWGP